MTQTLLIKDLQTRNPRTRHRRTCFRAREHQDRPQQGNGGCFRGRVRQGDPRDVHQAEEGVRNHEGGQERNVGREGNFSGDWIVMFLLSGEGVCEGSRTLSERGINFVSRTRKHCKTSNPL